MFQNLGIHLEPNTGLYYNDFGKKNIKKFVKTHLGVLSAAESSLVLLEEAVEGVAIAAILSSLDRLSDL